MPFQNRKLRLQLDEQLRKLHHLQQSRQLQRFKWHLKPHRKRRLLLRYLHKLRLLRKKRDCPSRNSIRLQPMQERRRKRLSALQCHRVMRSLMSLFVKLN
jgi:hypothetical protein